MYGYSIYGSISIGGAVTHKHELNVSTNITARFDSIAYMTVEKRVETNIQAEIRTINYLSIVIKYLEIVNLISGVTLQVKLESLPEVRDVEETLESEVVLEQKLLSII